MEMETENGGLQEEGDISRFVRQLPSVRNEANKAEAGLAVRRCWAAEGCYECLLIIGDAMLRCHEEKKMMTWGLARRLQRKRQTSNLSLVLSFI
jgi:hypothetical protein